MFQLKYLFLAGLILSLTACTNTHRDYHDSQEFFGGEIHITLFEVDKATATQAFTTLWEDLEYMHTMWHPWQPGSLRRTNTLLPMNREFSVNPSVLPLIDKARPLSSASNYLYNPAIGKLAELWGFHRPATEDGSLPNAEQIQSLVTQNPTLNDIELHGIRMQGTNPVLKLDFGTLAKGLAMDSSMLILQQFGLQHAIIDAGGDVKVMGIRGDEPWQVTIPDPRDSTVLARLNVFDGESVFTSSVDDEYFVYKGKRYHHILDPRTGYPVDDMMLVTVIHPDAATAAAATIALFVAGPFEWHEIARRMAISNALLIDNQGKVYMTPTMATRLRFSRQPPLVEISPPL